MTPTIDSLLVACRADPANDLPRLVLAEWLTDNGDVARAELIQVQCELAKPECTMQYVKTQELKRLTSRMSRLERGDPRWIHELEPQLHQAWVRYVDSRDDLRRREQELLKRHAGEWARPLGEAFEAYCWNGKGITVGRWQEELPDLKIPVSFVRGLLHVEAPLDTLREGLPRLGRELLWVESVHCSDREPERNDDSFTWWENFADRLVMGYMLPSPVFTRLRNGRSGGDEYGGWRDYDSREAALADLAVNGDLSSWILEEAWTAAELSWPTRETTPTGG